MKWSIMLILFLLLMPVACAKQISITKEVESNIVSVNENVVVMLRINNPFDSSVLLQIRDKNIIGNNGYDIQCMEYEAKPGESVLKYEPIIPFSPGRYTLDKAQASYTNPETGKQESVESNSVDIEVKGTGQGYAQGITTLYACNGQYIKSTSYSYGTSTTITISSGGTQINYPSQSQGNINQRVQQNQLNQDMNAVKRQMEREVRKREEAIKQAEEKIMNNSIVRDMHNALIDSGYNLTNKNIDVDTSQTGSFELTYEKNGSKAWIRGSIKNGSIEHVEKVTQEGMDKVIKGLLRDPAFKKYDSMLRREGLKRGNISVKGNWNKSRVEVSYEKNGREEAKIIAKIERGKVKSIMVKRNKANFAYILLLPIALIIFIIIAYYLYKRLKRKEQRKVKIEVKQVKREEDYISVTRKMLSKAKGLHDKGMEKEAYAVLACAIRFYYARKHGVSKELTNAELLALMKRKNYSKAVLLQLRKNLNKCALVEFAKYKPKKYEFDKIFEWALGCIEKRSTACS
ncbi:MAG: hypothetical protein DRP03_02975 [Candidatus Aenigmatarchaeota archaeon]|nr:MAG: hypothetical protein DRP03_02975 [Candidatus Aenigmarchaeota archaeon]